MIDFVRLQSNPLFKGMSVEEIKEIVKLFEITSQSKGNTIIFEKDIVDTFYIVLEGKISISKYDFQGNKNVVTFILAYDLFAESIALSNIISPYTVECVENTTLLCLDVATFKKLTMQSNKLFNNIIDVLSSKNAFLTFKIDCLSKHTIKERLFELFNYYYINTNSTKVKLPYNKSQLADFLAVNRSSLTRELAKMEETGYFKYKDKVFHLNAEMLHLNR